MAGLDVPQALERELAGHPVFGDTRGISSRSGSSIAVWDPDVPETAAEWCFASFMDDGFLDAR